MAAHEKPAQRDEAAGRPVTLARYACDVGERVLVGQRVDGVVQLRDEPGDRDGRAFLVEPRLESMAELEAIVADYVQKRRDRPRPGRLKCARPCVLRGGAEQRADVAIGSEMQLSLAQPGQIRHACRIKRGPIRGEDRPRRVVPGARHSRRAGDDDDSSRVRAIAVSCG